jgi:hypothetical protein
MILTADDCRSESKKSRHMKDMIDDCDEVVCNNNRLCGATLRHKYIHLTQFNNIHPKKISVQPFKKPSIVHHIHCFARITTLNRPPRRTDAALILTLDSGGELTSSISPQSGLPLQVLFRINSLPWRDPRS